MCTIFLRKSGTQVFPYFQLLPYFQIYYTSTFIFSNIFVTFNELVMLSVCLFLQNQFHIDDDEGKKAVFFSGLKERFRGFKSKLGSGWITMNRERVRPKNIDADGSVIDKRRDLMPYDKYPHISKAQWEAFVAQKTTPEQVVSIHRLCVVRFKKSNII